MRTGAIFARGSCRALKWMALFGVMFALGAGSAAAQASFTSAEWTPEENELKIGMDAKVWSRSPTEVAKDFTVSWGSGVDAMMATGTTSNIPTSDTGAQMEFMVTLSAAIPTGAGGNDGRTGIVVAYSGPADEGGAAVNAQGILDTSAGHEPTVNDQSITVTEKDVRPMLESIDDMTFKKGDAIEPFMLPAATGNATFTYAVSDLPAGLAFASASDMRMVSGTPTTVTEEIVTYTATDTGRPSGPVATSTRFTITVTDKPDAPSAPVVTPTPGISRSLSVKWMMPEDNNADIFDYEVRYRKVGAPRWQDHTADLRTSTSAMFSDLEVGDEYEFAVRARNDVGWSDWSEPGKGTPEAEVLSVTMSAALMTIPEGSSTEIIATTNRPVAMDDGTVTVNLTVVGEATLSTNSITIGAGDMSGMVMLTSTVDDDHVDDTVTVVATGTGITGDHQLAITVTDPEPAAALDVMVSAAPTTIAEGGTSTITAMANRMVMASDGAVTVNLRVVGEATLSMPSITIAEGADSGTVTLTSTEDDDYENDTVTVTATGTGVAADHPNVEITVTDPAPAAVLEVMVSAAPTKIAEGGTSTITAMANRMVMAADGVVTVNLRVVGEATLSANSITIGAGDTSGTVTLTSTEDDDYEDDTVTVTASGTGIADDHPNVEITVTDPAPPATLSVTVSAAPTTIAEGKTSTITATANRMVAEADGVVTVNLSVVGDGTLSADSITIDAGDTSGTVTLTSTEDDDYEDDTVTVTASGVGINGNHEVEIAVTDNDQAPVQAVRRGQLTAFELIGSDVSEKTIAGTKRYHVPEGAQNVQLSVTVQWTHDEIHKIGYDTAQRVDVRISSDRDTTGNSPAGAANWLSWIDDDGDVHFAQYAAWDAGHGYSTASIEVKTPREGEIPAAQRRSTRHVKSREGKIDVLILHDNHEAENDAFYIEAFDSQYSNVDLGATRAVNKITPEVVIEDDEDQSVTVKMGTRTSSTVYEGDSGDDVPEFTVAADPRRYDLPLEVRLDMVDLGGTTVSAGEISVSAGSLTLNDGNTGNSDTVTVHLPASDGNRVDDDYELQASVNVYSVSSGGYRTIEGASHPITVLDRHKLPEVTVSPKTGTVEEGGTIELTVRINRNPSNTPVNNEEKLQYTQEEVTVMLDMGMGSTASRNDFSPVESVVFPKRERGAYTAEKTVEVMVTADNELDDMEVLVLDAMVAGADTKNGSEKDSHPAVSTLTIEEGTAKLVWAKTQDEVEAAVYAAKNAGMGDDMMFNPGDVVEVMGSALFNAAEGVTVSYSTMSSDGSVASTSVDNAGMAMVTAMGAGMADITITAHASMPSGVKILDQTDPREASIMFPVEVGLEALTLMLTGPEDMNVVEGGMGAMVTVTANRAVTEEVTVRLMRDRAMSTASDADFTAEPIVIAAGMMTGSTMVMAVEDGMMESVDNMAEELVLYGMAEGMAGEVSGQVKLYLWDAAVPALPVIAQLLLAALMALGGYRRYRRR